MNTPTVSLITNTAMLKRTDDAVLEIAPPEGSKIRVRRIVTRSRARSTGKYPSWKVGRMVQWESVNELNAFRLLDASAHVRTFCEQPMWITYRLRGELYLHAPDALIVISDRQEILEVKPMAEALEPDCAARTALMTEALPPLGYTYRVAYAEHLMRQPRLGNALALLKHGRPEPELLGRERLRRVIDGAGSITWGTGSTDALGRHGRGVIARAFLEGTLTTDIDAPLTPATVFHPAASTIQGSSHGNLIVS